MPRVSRFGTAILASLVLAGTAAAQTSLTETNAPILKEPAPMTSPWTHAVGYPLAVQEPAQEPAVETPPAPDAAPAVEPVPAKTGYAFGNYFGNKSACNGCRSANWCAGANALLFWRNYEDDVNLSNESGTPLFSTDADHQLMGGFEAVLTRRACNGTGIEFRYWGLYPDTAYANVVGAPVTVLTGLNQVSYGGETVYDIYNRADSHWVYRDTTINNFEMNFLHTLGSTNCGKCCWEWLAGFRYFSLDESIRYSGFAPAGTPAEINYDNCVFNDLYGFQLGARGDCRVGCRWGYRIGAKVGVYNNQAQVCQTIHDGAGTFATINSGPYSGRDYAFETYKEDVAVSGEIDLGLTYMIGCRTRLIGGYRILGFSGVALAADQIPSNFADADEIGRVDSNGSLIMNGMYFGLETCF